MYKFRKVANRVLRKMEVPQAIRLRFLKAGIKKLGEEDASGNTVLRLLEKKQSFPISTSLSDLDILVNDKLDLSIIVPAYNVNQYIDACLLSLIKQETKYHYEIIVVNDGSTDSTLSNIMKYKDNSLIKIIDKSNGGLSSARNRGLENSHGKYISFVDSDDIVESTFVEDLVSVAMKAKADIVQGSYQILGNSQEKRENKVGSVRKINPFTSLYGYPWGKIYRTSLFKNVKFPENFWFEDTMMMYRVWPKAKVVYTISNIIYNYRINLNGITKSSNGNKKSLESLYITMQLLSDYKKATNNGEFTMNMYDFTLQQMVMNFKRIIFLKNKLLYASFVVMCDTLDKYFPPQKFVTGNKKLTLLEQSLRNRDYGLFVMFCLDN